MAVEITLNTPLADALNAVIQPKLVDVGWSTGGVDDSALSEYIILMLVNGKTQDQIAAELSGDLLNLGPDDPGAIDFSRWLFEQVDQLDKQFNGGQIQSGVAVADEGEAENQAQPPLDTQLQNHAPTAQDAEMEDVREGRPQGQMYVVVPAGIYVEALS